MAYTDNFPQRPVFMADFANGGRVDPRISYSRSTTGTYFGTDKHLSSENLFVQSSDFDTTWSKQGLEVPTGGQADPAGGTDGFTLEETAGANFHHIWQSPAKTGDLAMTVYAKQNSGARYVYVTIWNAVNDWQIALFDLAGGAPATSNGSSSTFTGVTATQTASGNGYYKCTLKATGTASVTYIGMDDSSTVTGFSTGYGVKSYTGDGTSSLDIAFASLSTTGATDYNATTTQIHREYAPTLQTAAINAPRFEHSASDSASEAIGQSRGLLIEGQFQQLAQYTEDLSNAYWTKTNTTVQSNAAVAPDGTLTADLVVESDDASNQQHICRSDNFTGISSGVTYTATVYAKAAGRSHCLFYTNIGGANTYRIFNLADGSLGDLSGSGTFSSTSVGNGWYRLQMTFTTVNTNSGSVYFYTASDSSTYEYTGNGYGSLLLWGANLTQSSHSYSYLKADGAATTKAADSLTVAMADVGVSQGSVSAVVEGVAGSASGHLIGLSDGSSSNRWALWRPYATEYYRLLAVTDNATVVSANLASATKFAMRIDTDDFAVCGDGGTVVTDTAGVAPVTTTIGIGVGFNGSYQANGTIKRVALYNEALSDTNLQALTS